MSNCTRQKSPTNGINVQKSVFVRIQSISNQTVLRMTGKMDLCLCMLFFIDFLNFFSYGESGTSTSDHETKKCKNIINEKRAEETCDLERELEKLRGSCKQENKNHQESDDSEIEEVEESCNKCGSSDEEIPDECTCENENYESDYENEEEEEDDDECRGECERDNKERITKECAECDIVEKVVAELVLKECEVEDDANKPKPEPKKKKPLYKSKFGRFGRYNNENTNFEVIQTEHGRFRGCCRHKVEHIEGMPHYKGAVSLYGLSEEQYEKRQERLQKLEQQEKEKVEKLKEEYVKKATETEDAFAQWMKQKAKSKSSRIKNMYDQKPKKPQKLTTGQKGPISKNNKAKSAAKVNNVQKKKYQISTKKFKKPVTHFYKSDYLLNKHFLSGKTFLKGKIINLQIAKKKYLQFNVKQIN